jgi:hypothetical protein
VRRFQKPKLFTRHALVRSLCYPRTRYQDGRFSPGREALLGEAVTPRNVVGFLTPELVATVAVELVAMAEALDELEAEEAGTGA